MVAVFSENLRVFNAENFKNAISAQIGNTRIYLTIGKVEPWANDSAPAQANSSVIMLNEIWNNMFGAKLITGNDVRHVVPRYNWAANTSYAMYDHCTCSLLLHNANSNFYVVNSEWNVYKCLSNNRNSLSTVEPTQILTDTPVEESDGYIWKYMYTISDEEKLRFTTDNFIPVKTIQFNDNSLQWQVQENAVEGSIDAIRVINSGNNYTNANNITITIDGDGVGANAIARVNTTSNTISSIVLTSRGSNYTFANVIISTTDAGTNASARAMISPSGGHGSDPLRELGGGYLLINTRLRNSENGKLVTDNDYRQVAILRNIRTFDDELATDVAYDSTITLTLTSGVTDYTLDEYVYQGGSLNESTFSGQVASWNPSNSVVKLINFSGTPTIDSLIGALSGTARFIQSIEQPELKKYTGELIYVDNIQPIQRAPDQTEDYKIVLKF